MLRIGRSRPARTGGLGGVVAVLLLSLAIGALPPAGAITGGQAESWAAHPWMVQIQQNHGPAWFTACSGTLIGPTHVLTAAHCTESFPDVGSPLQPNENLTARYRVVLANGHVVTPTKSLVPADFNYDAGSGDMAVLVLPAPAGLPALPLDVRNPTIGSVGTGFGFGCTQSDENACVVELVLAALGLPPAGAGQLRSDQETVLMAGSKARDSAAAALCGSPVWQICTLARTGVTRDGDSGGPLLTRVGGRLELAGVVHDQANTDVANQTGQGALTTTWTSVASECAYLLRFAGR